MYRFYKQHPEQRLAALQSPADTLTASYRSGWRQFSQFVPTPPPASPVIQPDPESPAGEDARPHAPRFLSPRECARLQGFPETYKIGAKGSW